MTNKKANQNPSLLEKIENAERRIMELKGLRHQMRTYLNGSGQGTRRFYLNEKSERVWIDMPSEEWQQHYLKSHYQNDD